MEETAKETMIKTIQAQPDDSSYDEILKELAFRRMVKRGLEDSKNGRTVTEEELDGEIQTWGK